MRMAQTVETLIRENIFGVFGEYDAQVVLVTGGLAGIGRAAAVE
jgi:hypothetical protein